MWRAVRSLPFRAVRIVLGGLLTVSGTLQLLGLPSDLVGMYQLLRNALPAELTWSVVSNLAMVLIGIALLVGPAPVRWLRRRRALASMCTDAGSATESVHVAQMFLVVGETFKDATEGMERLRARGVLTDDDWKGWQSFVSRFQESYSRLYERWKENKIRTLLDVERAARSELMIWALEMKTSEGAGTSPAYPGAGDPA